MIRRVALLVGLLSTVAVAVLVAAVGQPAPKRAAGDHLYPEIELFTEALTIVQSDYVEEPDPKQLIYGALKGMLAGLDPHSQFMDPDTYSEMKVQTEGEFGGIGIEISIRDQLLTVVTPIDGTPAYKAGLHAGDRIVAINGEATQDLTLHDAVKQLRGKPGTTVELTILREGADKFLEFTMTREIIKIETIQNAELVDGTIGYVRVADFKEKTADDLRVALNTLLQQGMTSLILDLRNNPGGVLDGAVAVVEELVPAGNIVVTTAGRIKKQNMEFRTKTNPVIGDLPLLVLVNGGSASASEIVAGAIQDHHRGILLGMKTFGKGSVQTIIPLSDGSALKLTTSKYFTPSGRSIHGEGIMPDVVVEPLEVAASDAKKPDEDAEAIFENLKQERAKQEPPQPERTELQKRLQTDQQLARAVDLLKGIEVYQRR